MATVGEQVRKSIKRNISKGTGVSKSTSSSNSSSNSIQNQISNYQKRLAALGYKDEDVTDTRNPLEKLLNLEKDQNVIFDIFEILNRPQNALFSGIAAAQEGDDFLEGAKEGIKGERKTSGKDLLVNAGMDDTDSMFDMADILGFGLDVFADPMNIPLIPSGGKLVSGSQWVFNKAGKGIKSGAKLADKGIEKALDAMDNSAAKKIQTLVDEGMDLAEASKVVGKSTDKLQVYQDIKKGISRTFDSSKNLGGLVGKSREADNIKNLEKFFGERSLEDIRNTAQTIAQSQKSNPEKTYKMLLSKLSNAVEADADWTLKGSDVINKFKASKTADFFTKGQAESVKKALDSFGIKTTLDGRKLILDSKNDIKKLYTISNAVLDEDAGIKFADNVFGRKMSDETFKEIQNAKKYFEKNKNPEIKALYEKAKEASSKQAKLSGELRGINPENITKEGYLTHNLNRDVYRSQIKGFDTRKYDMPIAEANRIKKAEMEAGLGKTQDSIKKLQSQIYKTNDEGGLILNKAGKPIRDDNLYNTLKSNKENYINEMQKRVTSYNEILKKQEGLDVDVTKLTTKGERSLKTIERSKSLNADLKKIQSEIDSINFKDINPENAESIKNVLDDYNEYTKKVTGLKNYAGRTKVDEVGGLYKRKEQVKGIYENIQNSKRKLTASMTEARNMADKTNRDLIKKANKSIKDVYTKGQKYARKDIQRAAVEAKVKEIYKNAQDMVDNLTKKINFEKASLDKLKGAGADAIFNQKIDKIDKLSKAAATLSDDAAKEFFTTAFDMNFAEYVKRSTDFNAGAQKFNDALLAGMFNDGSEFVKTVESVGNKTPYGFKRVNGSALAKKLEKYEGILSDEGKELVKEVTKYVGDDLYVDKELLDVLGFATKEAAHPLLRVWDGINNTFKKFSTLSPGFQMRNIIGNSTNMVLSGVPASELPAYYKKATTLLNEYDSLFKKFTEGTLDAAEKTKWDALIDFGKAGFDNAYTKIQDLDTLQLKNAKNPIDKLAKKSMELNEKVDKWNRMTLYLYAKDNPEYMAKLGVKNATDAVRKVLFDPSNISNFEKNVAKRMIPFYTFTKQNLMFQMDNIMRNTPRYSKLYKAINSIYDNDDIVGKGNYQPYQKESMQIPLPFKDDDGNQLFLKSNLPTSDLGEWMANPLQRTLASTSPVIKTPFEMATGKDLFTGQDFNKGATSDLVKTVTGKGLQGTSKKWASMAEQLLSGMGLSNITTNNVKKVSAILKKFNGDINDNEFWAEFFRSILQNTNQEKLENSRLYEDLEAYQTFIKELKKQGIDVPTIKELTNQNKRTIKSVKTRRATRNRY